MNLGNHLKLFEIRDDGTHIPAMGILMRSDDLRETAFLRRGGYGPYSRCVMLVMLATAECQYDPYAWRNPRTMGNAHRFIEENWDALQSGVVIDVEFILGETTAPKISELNPYMGCLHVIEVRSDPNAPQT